MSLSWATPYRGLVKPLADRLLASIGFLLISPVFIVVAIGVRTRLGSPVLFRQKRIGLNDRVFLFYKFRTMTDARDENGQLLPDSGRQTPFGRFLRSSSLDELPQLWNVVRGDMSLIGPRPLLPQYLERYSPVQRRRHEVRPGITGLAQVKGRNSLSWDEKFELDVRYVDRLSARLDCEILLLTIASVLRRKGISQEGHATMPEFLGSNKQERPPCVS
jgi:lipopolysaccharide/colanic/teichoic acid biosynthesis glycosyltransferase